MVSISTSYLLCRGSNLTLRCQLTCADNFGGHMFYPYSSGGGWLNHDWFEHARLRGGSLLWTEDCELLHALPLVLAPC